MGIVEDDAVVRKTICLMLEALGMDAHAFGSAQEYLDDPHARDLCTCLILDVRLPGISGLELQKLVLKQRRVPAIVFITGHAEVPLVVEAMRNGAVDFLQKPFKEQQLLDSVQCALALGQQAREEIIEGEAIAARLACLTPREKEVLACLLRSLRSKDIAVELGLTARTVEDYRAKVMKKMHAKTLSDLTRMCNSIP